MDLRQFADTLALTNKEYKLTDKHWDDLEKIRIIFKECFLFTKRAQSNQMTVSDFYAEWLELKLKLEKNEYRLAKELVDSMNERETNFMESPVTLSSLFLDSRYRLLLKGKPMAPQTSINHLACLWKRIRDLESVNETSDSGSHENVAAMSAPDNNSEEVNDFERYLNSLESNNLNDQNSNTCEDVMQKLMDFDTELKTRKRDPKSNHAMDFWESNKNDKKELYKMATIIFAVASTEVSVERNFSALSFILNKYRCSLSDEMLADI